MNDPNADRAKTAVLLDDQKRVLQMVNDDAPLPEVLEAICHAIEKQKAGMLCSILLLDDEGRHLLHGAAPSLPVDYCEAIHGITIGQGVGSCGTAAFTGQPCYVSDVSTHPNWVAFKGLAHDRHGLRSCWSTPIRSYGGEVVATFAMYYRDSRMPDLQDRKLIDFTSHLVSIAINRQREMARLAPSA